MSKSGKSVVEPGHEIWDREWRKHNHKLHLNPNQKVVDVIRECFNDQLKHKKILELGAGSGSDIIYLAQNGAEGYAIDLSSESVENIRYWTKRKGVNLKIIKADIKNIPFPDNYFDAVYSVGVMEHFRTLMPLLQEQIRVIKPGGFLIVDVPQKYTLYTILKHVRMKSNNHPFGWETEYSKGDLLSFAQVLCQNVYRVYGRELDIILRFPWGVRSFCRRLFSKTIERTFIAPYACLNIGMVLKIRK